MSQSIKYYNNLSDQDKKNLLYDLYINNNMSFALIAQKFDTYPNKIRRDAKNFGIPIRDKSEAQKNALSEGRLDHPTKGKERSSSTKEKIGNGVMRSWDSLSEEELNQRKQKSKEQWDKLSEDQKEYLLKKANDAVRQAGKLGSKLEKFLLAKLLTDGYEVEFHKEQTLSNTRLQIDLFLPKYTIAIEVDGPSHFQNVWGSESLNRNKKYDNKKQGLILGKGWSLIRVKQTKEFSKSRASVVYQKLLDAIKDILNDNTKSTISIEDN